MHWLRAWKNSTRPKRRFICDGSSNAADCLLMCWNQNMNHNGKKSRSRLLSAFLCGGLCVIGWIGQGSRAMAQVPPSQYGRVTLDKYSAKAGLGPVNFDHWLHRS